MKEKESQLIPHPDWQNYIPYEKPRVSKDLADRTLTEITNAMDTHVYVDQQGQVWVSEESLHVVLRTNKIMSAYYLERFKDENKIILKGLTYVRVFEVTGHIWKEIENSGLKKRGEYLKFSEECLRSIRDSDKARVIRGEHEENWKEEKKKLKNKRMKQYNIIRDELTGETLDFRTAEFSHIRSSSAYKHLALDINNGLIVNKTIHETITREGVIDEEQL
ncbi:hypothetical protein [Alkalicoccus luteus]|uniref:hypothetical protein n=1 Tax=Alkalicoccus luteus TaxID=1237094 RepID=UPI004034185F